MKRLHHHGVLDLLLQQNWIKLVSKITLDLAVRSTPLFINQGDVGTDQSVAYGTRLNNKVTVRPVVEIPLDCHS